MNINHVIAVAHNYRQGNPYWSDLEVAVEAADNVTSNYPDVDWGEARQAALNYLSGKRTQ